MATSKKKEVSVETLVCRYLKENPWSRTEEVAIGLDAYVDDVQAVIRPLRRQGLIKAKGIRRGTRYTLTKRAA
jgi:predicted transcriptional regulator